MQKVLHRKSFCRWIWCPWSLIFAGTGRAQTSTGLQICCGGDFISEVGWCAFCVYFVHEWTKFEGDTILYWQPVKLLKCWGDMISESNASWCQRTGALGQVVKEMIIAYAHRYVPVPVLIMMLNLKTCQHFKEEGHNLEASGGFPTLPLDTPLHWRSTWATENRSSSTGVDVPLSLCQRWGRTVWTNSVN